MSGAATNMEPRKRLTAITHFLGKGAGRKAAK